MSKEAAAVSITRSRHTTRLDEERRIVYGEVYVPFDPEATAVYSQAEVEARTDTYNTFRRSTTLELSRFFDKWTFRLNE